MHPCRPRIQALTAGTIDGSMPSCRHCGTTAWPTTLRVQGQCMCCATGRLPLSILGRLRSVSSQSWWHAGRPCPRARNPQNSRWHRNLSACSRTRALLAGGGAGRAKPHTHRPHGCRGPLRLRRRRSHTLHRPAGAEWRDLRRRRRGRRRIERRGRRRGRQGRRELRRQGLG